MVTFTWYVILVIHKGYAELTCWLHIQLRLVQILHHLLQVPPNAIFLPRVRQVKPAAVRGDFLGFAFLGNVARWILQCVVRTILIVVLMIIRFVIPKGICASRFVLNFYSSFYSICFLS